MTFSTSNVAATASAVLFVLAVAAAAAASAAIAATDSNQQPLQLRAKTQNSISSFRSLFCFGLTLWTPFDCAV